VSDTAGFVSCRLASVAVSDTSSSPRGASNRCQTPHAPSRDARRLLRCLTP